MLHRRRVGRRSPGNGKKAAENYRNHDPESPLIIGHLRPEDTVTQGVQKSLLARSGQQKLGCREALWSLL